MKKAMPAGRQGFTLIELLVVIVIIGVLSSLLMANFIGVRQRARDGQRKANLRQIQAALELYRADQGKYPDTASFPACNNAAFTGGSPPATYMSKIPCDPLGGDYSYVYSSGGYTLVACLENSNDVDKAQELVRIGFCEGKPAAYMLQNP